MMMQMIGWSIGLSMAAIFWVVVWLVAEGICMRFPGLDPEGVLVATSCGLAAPVALIALVGLGGL